jgi:diaminopimelate epimerase
MRKAEFIGKGVRPPMGASPELKSEPASIIEGNITYFNSDGNESTMCGNGGRCMVRFAHSIGLCGEQAVFSAIDGTHDARILENGEIRLHMKDITGTDSFPTHFELNTGSPHYVVFKDEVVQTDVEGEGRKIRNLPQYGIRGINVNFVERRGDRLYVRTYERGVEAETLSCGTGVTAAAVASTFGTTGLFSVMVDTPGGTLLVCFEKDTPSTAVNVFLQGPATFVFRGSVAIN